MTLQKLSAGSGYEYLTRQVAALNSTEKGSVPLADYYSAKGVWFFRCDFTTGSRCGGIATSRTPASDFGDPTTNPPSTRTTPRVIETRLVRRSMSPRRSSASSPNLIAHQAASSAISL